ncbi:MAG: polysaccharide pyruvyl transferase family protein [Acidimicrobiia bacterium]|nr:polysaccharide pyruvyl transferase family protein [Acidimicrobiia bacterium]
MTTLVTGWFSFEEMGATAGDLIARNLLCDWLASAGESYDVAVAPPFRGGVDWRAVAPESYDQVVFVCGPFGNGPPITEFLPRFAHCRLIGVNLSMLQSLDEWDPFDLLIERDSSRGSHPDLAFLGDSPLVPAVGVVQAHPQTEYGERGLHGAANDAMEQLLAGRELARFHIDTRLDIAEGGFRTSAEVESAIARMDAVVTTRLHGMVLAIKNGVPALAIDPIAGGAKVAAQAATIGWPICFVADSLDAEGLAEGLAFCLSQKARVAARECAAEAERVVAEIRDRLISYVAGDR